MTNLLEKVKETPGFVWAGLFSKNDGMLISTQPRLHEEQVLVELGRCLTQLDLVGRRTLSNVPQMHLAFDKHLLHVRWITDSYFLVFLVEPDVPSPQVYEMAQSTAEMLESDMLSAALAPGDQERAIVSSRQRPVQNGTSAERCPWYQSAPYDRAFDAMRNCLPAVLGPMGCYVFDDVFEQWCLQGGADKESLSRLMKLLDREINDRNRSKKYREMVRPQIITLLKAGGAR